MTKKVYALLVGIDNYDPASFPPVSTLKGCGNDIKAIEAYLRERIAKDSEWSLVEPTLPWILIDRDATRQAIIRGFKEHLCNADSQDVAFFYYSGHGAQEPAPAEFWSIEPDHLDETLVCYDSRTAGSRDLADKELAYLIAKVSQQEPHFVTILDCCHSGSGTRDISEAGVRLAAVDPRERPWSSFVFAEETTLGELLADRSLDPRKTGVVGYKGKHIAFSACRDHELAKEYKGEDGQSRGAFSYFLLQTLQRTNGSLTYRDLARNLNAIVSGKVKEQSPQVNATDPEELGKPFLGGAIQPRPSYFTLYYSNNDNSWMIDGGVLHGMPTSSSGSTLLAFFPAGSTPEQLRQLSNALGEVRVTQVRSQESKVEFTGEGDRLSEQETYWAVVTSLPIAPLSIYIRGDHGEEKGVELARQALQQVGPDRKPSLFVRLVDAPVEADYYLIARSGQYWITLPSTERAVVAPIPEKPDQAGYTSDRTFLAIQRLEQIARWNNILELASPSTSGIHPSDVEMEIILVAGIEESATAGNGAKTAVSERRLEYTYKDGEWHRPAIQIRLTNHSQKALYCGLLDVAENYAVEAIGLPELDRKNSLRLSPQGETGAIVESEVFEIEIPATFLEQGITEYKDVLKLIVSTTDFDPTLLEQEKLDLPRTTRSISTHQGTLNQLMARVNTRQLTTAAKTYDDWMTTQVAITTVRSPDAKQIQPHAITSLQNGVVEVQPHPSLEAKVSLTTVPQVIRDLGNLILPPILRQDPRVSQPFQFTASRGSDPGLSALELIDVKDYTVVTKEAPLKLLVDTTLGENEHLLPIGYDGEFFLPLGRSQTKNGKTEIKLERLPSPTVSSRSLKGSIRIFFQKVMSQKLGSPFEYPILATAQVEADGTAVYEKSQEQVKAQVAQAQRIVLYVHGIIGDTQSMVPSIQQAQVKVNGKAQSLRELFDLVLTFDYENINTTIEENARLLGQRLQSVGLGPHHGKELHIVAHSMGGLVSRWFIEREGGDQVVQHLVMLGTPNAGSPWPAIQNWAFTALGVALNQLSTIVWPAKTVADLLQFLEDSDNSLDEMQPDSAFFKEIAEERDPQVPYTIVAGDRSIILAATQVESEQSSPLQRLMQRLFGKAVDKVVNLAFFQQPNDIAVTLTSIKNISSSRSPQPRILLPDTACDHLTYFTSQAGLDALAMALLK